AGLACALCRPAWPASALSSPSPHPPAALGPFGRLVRGGPLGAFRLPRLCARLETLSTASDHRPARAREGDAGARLQLLSDVLDAGEQRRLVDEGLAVGVDDDAAGDDHPGHAPAPRGVDEACYRGD